MQIGQVKEFLNTVELTKKQQIIAQQEKEIAQLKATIASQQREIEALKAKLAWNEKEAGQKGELG